VTFTEATFTEETFTAVTITEEQEILRENVRKLLRRDADPWLALCEQIGVAALGIPEKYGGFDAGLTEVQLVSEELGRVLADVPFLGSAVLTTRALLESRDDEACARLLPLLAEGAVGAFAWWETDFRVSGGSQLDGRAQYVLDGDSASVLLVVADAGLFEVDVEQNGVQRRQVLAMDETRRLATIELTGARARRIGSGDFRSALPRIRDVACAVLAAEQAGAAARALEITVEYCKQRHQFGRPIGGFQAVKHRLADLYVLVETARSAAYAGAESPRLAAVAKAYCSEAFHTVAAEMIQLHGGIAITWEHEAHRFFKRAHGTAQLFGQPHEHLRRVAGGDVINATTGPP
jgi:alkylation response protein AidB-like acyl-CoA dehydrogenase